ncbi:MAG: transglutaminase domain-containing protein [Ilumatobacter sp.]|uniref:transglutaminase domain-containing protein n=1 Tax=Ilumatobacter sp. TaxID=1967498 RepID=UPI00391B1B70
MGIPRVRIALISAMGAIIALAAGGIFDERRWELLVVPVVIGAAGILSSGRGGLVRLATSFAAVVVAVVAATLLAGGGLGDAATAFTSGARRMVSTDWPSPSRPDLVATAAAGLGSLLALATALAHHARLHLTPLVPVATAQVAVSALSAPLGPRLLWLLVLGVLAIAFAAIRPGMALPERLTLLSGERRLIPVAAVTIGLAGAMALPMAFDDRADPRQNEDPVSSAALLDPIEATLALQAIDPPIDLHTIDLSTDSELPTRWRSAALVNYDGRRWTPTLTLRPIGRRLDATGSPDIAGSIGFLDEDVQLVPLPGAPVTIETRIETDPDRTIVRLSDRPIVGERVDFTARVDPSFADVSAGSVATREIDESVSGLTALAESLLDDAADGPAPVDVLGRLRLLESTMSEDFVLDPAASGGGLQRALILRFLRDTRRGNAEQFATGFVLLARSLGVDARVATGFTVDPAKISSTTDGVRIRLSSAEAAVWPEVDVGGGWLAFDPVPTEAISDLEPEPPEPQVQSPAAPQPPIEPPPDADENPTDVDDDALAESDPLPRFIQWALRVAAVTASILVPLLLAAALVLSLKWRRRRRRLSGPPDQRIRGAWAVATNRLVDAGLTITPAATNDEIAADGTPYAASAERELRRLATLASAVTFGEPARPDLLADDANSCLGQVETTMAASRTRWQRLRWRLSTRSLRRRTTSPV